MNKYNVKTLINGRTKKSKKNTTIKQIDNLVKIAEKRLSLDRKYMLNANINGITVQLRTNDSHLQYFWSKNWFKAKEKKPIITIWAVTGIKNQEPYAYYNSKTRRAVFFNTNYYGQCKSWALGAVADFREMGRSASFIDRKVGWGIHTCVHSLHAACVDVGGQGIVIIAPTGTGKSTLTYGLLKSIKKANLHSDDWIYVIYKQKEAIADISEKFFYMRTNTIRNYPKLKNIFDKSPCENVKEIHGKMDYLKTPNSRAMVNPALLGKSCIGGVYEKTKIRYVFLLRRNKYSRPMVKLNSGQAIKILAKGAYTVLPGAGPRNEWNKIKYEPWYNPYLLVRNKRRTTIQKRFFRELFKTAECYIFNTGVISVKETLAKIKSIIR